MRAYQFVISHVKNEYLGGAFGLKSDQTVNNSTVKHPQPVASIGSYSEYRHEASTVVGAWVTTAGCYMPIPARISLVRKKE